MPDPHAPYYMRAWRTCRCIFCNKLPATATVRAGPPRVRTSRNRYREGGPDDVAEIFFGLEQHHRFLAQFARRRRVAALEVLLQYFDRIIAGLAIERTALQFHPPASIGLGTPRVLAKPGFAEVELGNALERKRRVGMLGVKGPHVEIAHAGRAVEVMQRRAPAQRGADNALAVQDCPLVMTAEEIVALRSRQARELLQIRLGNALERTIRHSRSARAGTSSEARGASNMLNTRSPDLVSRPSLL